MMILGSVLLLITDHSHPPQHINMSSATHSCLSFHLSVSSMAKKRRNAGRSKHGRGNVVNVTCNNCGRCVSKDKAVKRFIVRNIVDQSSQRDIKEASVYESYALPKLFIPTAYCISCAVHARIVRARPAAARRNRDPPARPSRGPAGAQQVKA
jgi:small subunit ribosomal protein S26e